MAKYEFETEVSEMLNLIINSLYSNEEIFLRELISNASDALDKLKFLTVSDDAFKSVQFDPRIDISFDDEKNIIIIRDTGIGMDETDLKTNLGTIARSGTKKFLENLEANQKKDSNLIGQFGVGFYSAFMVAKKIEVISKKANSSDVYKWSSDGTNSYEIEKVSDADFPLLEDVKEGSCGSAIILYLKDTAKEYLSRYRLQQLVKKYSDHVAFKIYLHYTDKKFDSKGNVESEEQKSEQINDGTALWQKSKSELSDDDYLNFYKSYFGNDEPPLLHIHTKAEGTQEYTTLFYIPSKAPFDMYFADYTPGVKLFVKRVFITDDDKELLPSYLRFVRGIIDSEDLPLNVSREILQQNRILFSIKNASVKKILNELKKLSENDATKYVQFVNEYNKLIKEGIYSDFENKDILMDLVRFKTTVDTKQTTEGWTSLADYVSRMQADQKEIYYLAGDNEKIIRNSPHLQFYKNKGYEVLLLDDEIDGIVMPMIRNYKDFEFKAINEADNNDASKENEASKTEIDDFKPLLKTIKTTLKDKVKDVRVSKTLTDSPACITYSKDDPTLQMQKMMKAMGRQDITPVKPILELNINHPILQKLKDETDKKLIENYANVLLSQSQLAEGVEISDPSDFVKSLNELLSAN